MKISKLTLALVLLATVPLALAQGTYTQIDYPGALGTQVNAIDKNGDVVGSYSDAASTHGFLLSNGTYTTIDYPGALDTVINGLNDTGKLVGFTDPQTIAFVYDRSTQTFTGVSYPHALVTIPVSINDAGTITGYFWTVNSRHFGFELLGASYREISVPGSDATLSYGVTASNELVGVAEFASKPEINFLFNGRKYQDLAIGTGYFVTGVNSTGTAFVGTGPTGFLYQGRTLQSIQFPNSNGTFPYGVNDAEEVAGFFVDKDQKFHGFTWTPPADAAK
jgi:hypothetical protein